MAQVDLVIPNLNGLRFLKPCLDSVLTQTFRDIQVWLVDNGSTDGSVPYVQMHYPQVRLIANTTNKGFSAGNNQAIRAGAAELVATLNNDTTVEPQWLETLVDAMLADARVGMCASKMLFADRRDTINSAGVVIDRVGIAWDRLGGEVDKPDEDAVRPVFGPCAGAALYRRAMLDEIGLFDEDFFAYLEDTDLAWRARWAGWQALYVPAARVYHFHTGTFPAPIKSRLLGRNKVWLIAKNYPSPYLLAYLPLIAFYDLAAVVFAIASRHDLNALRGRWVGLRGFVAMWRKRRTLVRRVSASHMMNLLAPIEAPRRVHRRYTHLEPRSSS